MSRDTGPYMEMDGPSIWVPRTVSYREARAIAKTGMQEYEARLTYVGKSEARLLGFVRDCPCDEVCEARPRCPKVPAWHFREVDR